jgi:hypothetical protein
MSSAIYTNTGIVESSWNSRGLITHNFINKGLIVQDNGVLWAVVRENFPRKYINIYKSTDNGFSWNNLWSGTFSGSGKSTGISGLNLNGPVMHLVINEKLKLMHLFHSYYSGGYYIELFTFQIGDNNLTQLLPANESWVEDFYNVDMDSLAFDISYTDDSIYMTYTYESKIYVRSYLHTNLVTEDGGVNGTDEDNFFDLISTHAEDNTTLHILGLRDFTSTFELAYLSYDKISGTFTTAKTITSIPAADIVDINLCRDGLGNMLAYWSQKSADDTSVTEYYSISYNDGDNWSTPVAIPLTTGQGDFIDNNTTQKSARTVAIECNKGFVLSYVRNLNDKAITYVRTLDYNDSNNTYTLSSESIACSHATKDVVGLRFFRPVGAGKHDIFTKEQIRFGFQLGEGDSTIQRDKIPVYFGQKLLNDEAFQESTIIEYNPDTPTENQLLAEFNLLGSTMDNVDFYAEGLTGEITKKYESAFNRFGTSIYVEQYEPIQESVLADKSSYSLENVFYVKAFFQDINYGFPAPVNESFDSYMERDLRKLHLPPDFHISRTFLINDGNKLRRSVWLAKFGGNLYELSQVVPKFVDNQIAYYTVNAYVVGPSRNPFTRTILPSET